MEIRLIKNVTKGKYISVNRELMLQIVDDNKVFDCFTGKRMFLFNPSKNVHIEIMPQIAKYDIFKIYHGMKNRDFFIFTSLKVKNETDVQIDYYCYNISSQKCRNIHTDIEKTEMLRKKNAIKIFALTQDYCIFQKYNESEKRYDILLKDIVDDRKTVIKNEELMQNGIDTIIPMAGNKCCFKIGNSLIGIVNVNQFISDMALNLPMVFTQVLDRASGGIEFTDIFEKNKNIIYTRKIPDNDIDEIVIYDYVNDIRKVRQRDSASDIIELGTLCVIGDVPYIYNSDTAGTHFVNLNLQREDYLISSEYRVEYIFNEYVITSRQFKFKLFKNPDKRIIEVFKIPDITNHVYKKRGIYNGCVAIDDDLLLFIE